MNGQSGKLGIIAGGGKAPRQLIRACQDMARPFFVFCLEGHADSDLGEGVPSQTVAVGALQKFKSLCAQEGITDVVMVGHVRRPSLAEIKPDLLALKILTKIGFHAFGDDGLLRGIGKALEEECGVRVIGACDVTGNLLTPSGVLTKQKPDEQAMADIKRGIEVARALGQQDVGQAVVVQQGLVLGVEAIEGTAALIKRCGDVKREGGGGVLVKLAKPQQDRRFDLPSAGYETLVQLKQAGFAGVALQAGQSLFLEREKTIQLADECGLFIIGFEDGAARV